MVRAHFSSVAMHIYSQCLSCGKLFIFNNENTSVRSPFGCTLCKWLALSTPSVQKVFSPSKSIISFCELCVRLHRTIYILSKHILSNPISDCPLKHIGLYKTFIIDLPSKEWTHFIWNCYRQALIFSHVCQILHFFYGIIRKA